MRAGNDLKLIKKNLYQQEMKTKNEEIFDKCNGNIIAAFPSIILNMEISKDQFPIVVQAFEITGGKDLFVAEQVVSSQSEIERFSTRYAGKVIKARTLTATEAGQHKIVAPASTRKSPVSTIVVIIIVILIILIGIGFYTGWIQNTFRTQ